MSDSQHMPATPHNLPGPFEWCIIPTNDVTLSEGGYIDSSAETIGVAGFYMAKYAITNAQFAVFEHDPDGWGNPHWWTFSAAARAWRATHNRPAATDFDGDELPRTRVTWYSAMAFTRWLSAKTGRSIALPTEAQWQSAAQGDDGRNFPWGDDTPTHAHMNYKQGVRRPTPVWSYPAGTSPYGPHNMAGNVWEWCLTSWAQGDNTGTVDDTFRVIRGGAWNTMYDVYCMTWFRAGTPPNKRFGAGFRVVCIQA